VTISLELLVAVVGSLIILVMLISLVVKFAPKPVRKSKFQKQWKDLQKFCAHKETWPRAVLDADELLNEALKRKRYKGTNMGERLVAAQRDFSDNEAIWWSHKLSQKIRDESKLSLKKKDVKEALVAFGQALKDIGVLK
jgi:hypothetical protein